MAKKLYLLRHAQTLDKQHDESDADRQLTAIGTQNATRMGINIKNKNIIPDMMISSPAIRARYTSELVAEQIGYDLSRIHYNSEIYNASIRTLLKAVNNFKDEWKSTLLVGHNPAITFLAEYLSGEPIGNMSTCGLVCLSFDFNNWSMVSENNAEFKWYEYPDLLNF
ncbi:MAG: histidine phosphatase family protein [Cyclobacteriaceae bacterium]|nr:histidine phosphatase family protein [Cyclobacteriaceae bacterium]